MDAENIVKLTPDAVRELVDARRAKAIGKPQTNEHRKSERWPFPGAVEVWLPEGTYGDRHILATMHNLSIDGLAMRTRRPLSVGAKIEIALHQPEVSLYGEAFVRHCTHAPVGYLVGVEFAFATDGEEDDEDDEDDE